MKKIVCEYCSEIIEVKDDDEVIYCPKCFKAVNVKQGEKRLPIFKEHRFEQAKIELNHSTEYKKAQEGFEKILLIDQENIEASNGLILAILYQSTVRDSHIKESHDVFKKYKNTLELLPQDFDIFINKVNKELNYYYSELKNRLMDYDHFFEEEGKSIFLKASDEIIEYKKTLVNSLTSKADKSLIQKEINEMRDLLKKDLYIESSPFHLLHSQSKEALISDKIYKDVTKEYKKRKRFLALFISSFGLFSVGILLIVILSNYLLIGVPIASIGFVLTLIFGIIFLSIEMKLR